jgi:hypothetical protein
MRLHAGGIMIAVTALACALLAGCGKDPPIWSATSPSPDGKWLAVAHTAQYSGFGTNRVETIVEIKDVKRNILLDHSQRVLGFMSDGVYMGLKMNWVTPSHLEVLFKDDPKVLYYQVVRTSGVEISVRNLSQPASSCQ